MGKKQKIIGFGFNFMVSVGMITVFSRDSDLTTSPRDADMLKKDVDMYKHIHIFSQHIHILCHQYEHIHIFFQHIHISKDVDMVKRDVDMFKSPVISRYLYLSPS